MENPGLIVAGIEALNAQEAGGGLAEETAEAERDLQKVQMEEDRAIRLYVSGKITEDQLDRQRRFITERLETLRARLDEYRSQQTALAEKRILMENVVTWAEKMGDSLDDLSDDGRRKVLELLLDGVTIDRGNNVEITLAVPTEDVVSIEPSASDEIFTNRTMEWAGTFGITQQMVDKEVERLRAHSPSQESKDLLTNCESANN